MNEAQKELKLSRARALPERARLVQLQIRDEAGEQFVVRCDALPARSSVRVLGRLPGEIMQLGLKEAGDADLSRLPDLIEAYEHLIESATAFAGPDDELIRPAFWFNEDTPRHELSVDGRTLPALDIMEMGNTILELSGYAGGAATAGFQGRE